MLSWMEFPQEDEHVFSSLFMIAVYGYFMCQGAMQISAGSELLLEVLEPGLVGGLLLPILGAVPDAMIILMSGLKGTVEQAQSQIAVGMGTLAGSTILLLTVTWGGCLVVGRCDLVETAPRGALRAKNKVLTVPWFGRKFLTRTGVTTDAATRHNVWAMLGSVFLYLVIQIPSAFGHHHSKRAAFATFALCCCTLVAYCAYQVIVPDLQTKKIAAARRSMMRVHAIDKALDMMRSQGSDLMNDDAVDHLFDKFDANKDGTLNSIEVTSLITGLLIGFTGAKESCSADIDYFIKQFDKDRDEKITRDEFKEVLQQWFAERGQQAAKQQPSDASPTKEFASAGGSTDSQVYVDDAGITHSLFEVAGNVGYGLDTEDEDEDEDETDADAVKSMTRCEIVTQSAIRLLAGTLICVIFSDPVVTAVSNASRVLSLPPFFVAFVVLPFASNSSELISSFIFASKKTQKNISLTFSQIYGAVTMNNTLCLGIFLALMAFRGLAWDFSSEVTCIIAITVLVSTIALQGVTFNLLSGFGALCLYPISIGLVIFLDYVVGWN